MIVSLYFSASSTETQDVPTCELIFTPGLELNTDRYKLHRVIHLATKS